MRIEVAGKGGSGKTTLSGTLARSFAATNNAVLAIDDDDDPNLDVSLGVSHTADVRPMPDDLIMPIETPEDEPDWELTRSPREIIEEYGFDAPDGVTLLQAGDVAAGDGPFYSSHRTTAMLLFHDVETHEGVTIVDMPAGLEVYGMAKYVDVLLMVVEPSYNSLETIRKLNEFATAYDVPDVRVIANNVRTDQDLNFVENYCRDHGFEVSTVIPHDDAIRYAEREGIAPIDYAEGSPAIHEIQELVDELGASHGFGSSQ